MPDSATRSDGRRSTSIDIYLKALKSKAETASESR